MAARTFGIIKKISPNHGIRVIRVCIPPLDGAIKESIDLGYTHHINRLMVISNLMNLSGIDPNSISRWFMEMYVDTATIGLWCLMCIWYGVLLQMVEFFQPSPTYAVPKLYASECLIIKKVIGVTLLTVSIGILLKKILISLKSNPRLSLMVNALNKINPERKKLISAES